MKTTTDTDGILDRCAECGARAQFTERDGAGDLAWGAQCSECANSVNFHISLDRAMVIWNQTQRHIANASALAEGTPDSQKQVVGKDVKHVD